MAKIVFNYGCMGSGKTSKMLTQFDMLKRRKKKPLIIKPCLDTRETESGSEEKFVGWGITKSRITKNEEPVYYFDSLETTLEKLEFGVLLVDEAQFLTREDVLMLCSVVDDKDIDVICYGLKTDVNGELFEGAKHLFALADEFVEIDSLCETEGCGRDAVVHVRFIDGVFDNSGKSVAIEKGNVTYKAVCRKCWDELKRRK